MCFSPLFYDQRHPTAIAASFIPSSPLHFSLFRRFLPVYVTHFLSSAICSATAQVLTWPTRYQHIYRRSLTWAWNWLSSCTRAYFMYDFSIVIQIGWKIGFSTLYSVISLPNFAHATTAQLSCHVQNFIAITPSKPGWEQNKMYIEFKLLWKNHPWNGPQDEVETRWLTFCRRYI